MKYTENEVRVKLSSDPKWIERAIVRLYERQTADEQRAEHTRNLNNRGFQPCDAFMFTRFAKWILSGKYLTPNQLAYCGMNHPKATRRVRMWRGRPVLSKYARQVLEMIEEKSAA